MSQQPEEQIIVRGTGEYWEYKLVHGGFLRVLANAIEGNLAACGRSLLLIFLTYCSLKTGALLVAPNWEPPMWLEMLMFGLQIAGLEGSIPALGRREDELRANNNEVGAQKIAVSMKGARWMTILAGVEGVLHLLFKDSHGSLIVFAGPEVHYMQVLSGILLVARIVVILSFLIELGKVDAKGPRIMTAEEFAAHEQKQFDRELQKSAVHQQLTSTQKALDLLKEEAHQREQEQERLLENMRHQLGQSERREQDLLSRIETMEQSYNETLSSTDDKMQSIRDLQIRLRDTEYQTQNLQSELEQKGREFETANLSLQSANSKISDLQIAAQNHLQIASDLQAANLQIEGLTAKLESANRRLANLQNADRETAKQPAIKQSKKPANTQKVTTIEEARAKHAGALKLTHEDVLNFMNENPSMKRAEVAQTLGISERKVYDAVAWGKDQQDATASAQ